MYYVFTSVRNPNIVVKIQADTESEAKELLYDTVTDESLFELTEIY